MSVYVGGSRYPDCFGSFQGKAMEPPGLVGSPVGGCRKCAPFRRCREEWIKRYRKEQGLLDGDPLCLGYSGVVTVCRKCSSAVRCVSFVEERERKIREKADNELADRLKAKTREKWGGS